MREGGGGEQWEEEEWLSYVMLQEPLTGTGSFTYWGSKSSKIRRTGEDTKPRIQKA